MNEREMSITMKLIDEVSKTMNSIEGGLQRFANSAKEVGQQMKSFGRDLSQIGNTLSVLGAAITGPLLLAFNSAGKYSATVKRQIDNLKITTDAFQLSLAQALVPVIEKLNTVLGNLLRMWQSLSPRQQELIVQGLFMTGVFLAIDGIVIKLADSFMRWGGAILSVASRLVLLALAHPVLALILLAVGALIVIFLKFHNVATNTLNAIEIAVRAVYIGFLKLIEGVIMVANGLLLVVEKMWQVFDKIYGFFNKGAKPAAQGIEDLRMKLNDFVTFAEQDIGRVETKMANAFGGEGDIAAGFDDLKQKINGLFSGLTNPISPDFFSGMQGGLNAGAGDAYVQDSIMKQQESIAQQRALWNAWHNEKTAMAMAAQQRENEFLSLGLDAQQKAHQSMWTAVGQMRDAFAAGMSDLAMSMINGAIQAREFFNQLGQQMLKILIDWGIQKAINFALAQVMHAAEVAIATATGAAIAAAWAPAAAMVSLATLGANSVPAIAGMTSASATAQMLAIPRAEEGATIRGSRFGSLVIAGENYKQENIQPLDRSGDGSRSKAVHVELHINYYNPVCLSEQGLDEHSQKVASKVSDILESDIGRS